MSVIFFFRKFILLIADVKNSTKTDLLALSVPQNYHTRFESVHTKHYRCDTIKITKRVFIVII